MDATLYIVNVEAAIYHVGRYLMIRRGAGETYAAGDLCMVGGKTEFASAATNALEETARREIREEVGVEVADTLHYVHSSVFVPEGTPVVDVVFLCQYRSGTPRISNPDEVAEILWMTLDAIFAHPDIRLWTRSSLERAEQVRRSAGW